MRYDPQHHHRRSVRLQGWDYAHAVAYFVTVCVQSRRCVLGDVAEGEMQMNAWGEIVAGYRQNLPNHFPNIELGAFVVMPNHVHFILWLNPPETPKAHHVVAQHVGAQFNCAPTPDRCAPTNANPRAFYTSSIGQRFIVDKQRPTLGQVVRAFKAATARLIRQSGGEDCAWQRNYYGHIIRNEDELHLITQYILANPANWATDDENPAASKPVPERGG